MPETIPWPLENVAGWTPLWKFAGILLATLVWEDAAAAGAGWLLAMDAISWPTAFGSCFLGIWFGDVGLYALARCAGRRWFERSSLKVYSANVNRSEQWFSERGALTLVLSRLVPGARLPAYLAAGFLRVPLPRFLLVTGAAAFVWALAFLWLAQVAGAPLARWLATFRHGGFALLAAGGLAFVALRRWRRLSAKHDAPDFSAKLGRWTRWEFWPPWLFYPPVAIHGLWLAFKYRGLTLPTAANPGIFSSGLIGESKAALLAALNATSPEFTAPAGLVTGEAFSARLRELDRVCGQLRLEYPFILKPDVGQRGVGVKLIRSRVQAEAYLRGTTAPLVAQRYAAGPHEVGIFYYRFPHEGRGRIFALTKKIFPVVTGDGRATVAELIRRDRRARFMAGKYLERFREKAHEVLPAGETLKLVEAGDHAQGCIFSDAMHLGTPELAARIDDISRRLAGFFIGRYDIRYASEADLRAGKRFQIVELNGAASEATSLYDARNSLWSAYRTLFRQWDLVFAIGAENRRRGCPPTSLWLLWQAWRAYRQAAATYPMAD